MNKICITGASGFIGKNLCIALSSSNKSARALVRNINQAMNLPSIEYETVGDIRNDLNWEKYLHGCSTVIHCAGKAHNMNEKDDIKTYKSINSDCTKQLAEHAIRAGVKRIIFLSTVKVNGEITKEIPFTSQDKPNPQDAYSVSKFEAEKALWEISSRSNLEVVVLRLPLVYGLGAKGNMLRLMKLIGLKIPLPLSLVKNKRSLIGIDNLIDLLIHCIEHPSIYGKTFLVSDEDVSTPELLKYIASAMGTSVKLFPVPLSFLKFFSFIIKRKDEINRLTSSLQVDSKEIREILNWSPPISIKDGIKRMVSLDDKNI